MQSTVLISGANLGMGLATALLLAEHGFEVYAGARTAEGRAEIERRASERSLCITPVGLDVQDTDSQVQGCA